MFFKRCKIGINFFLYLSNEKEGGVIFFLFVCLFGLVWFNLFGVMICGNWNWMDG